MRYAVAVWFALSSLAFPQNPTLNTTPVTATQVLYVADTTDLQTYNIDPQTLQPSLVGTTPLPKAQVNGIAVSSDGRFLYLMASDVYPATNNRIYVYDTNADGVPGEPMQSVYATNSYSMVVDPTEKFLYAAHAGAGLKNQTEPSQIYRYQVDSTTGELTELVNEATYILPIQDTNYCSLSIAGMNANGTAIHDDVFCATHEGANDTYDERTVNPTTGALGSPKTILTWSMGTIGSPDSVQFVKGLIFNFQYPINDQPFDALEIYRLPNTTTPLITCTASMLTACASDTGVAHPSAKYVFYTNPQTNATEVDAVDLNSQQIIATGTNFTTPQPDFIQFSPDGSLVYSSDYGPGIVSIFGFNASTAAITTGGSISESNVAAILPAERY
jgi:6-phosphogluconolactonase (cycloisomerase 2 family)